MNLDQFLKSIGGVSTADSLPSVRLLAARDSLDDRFAAAEAGAKQEIADAFALLRFLPAKQIAVPERDFRNDRVGFQTMDLAVQEMIEAGHGLAQLLKVLQESDCALVQDLREALCTGWQAENARDIAEVRA